MNWNEEPSSDVISGERPEGELGKEAVVKSLARAEVATMSFETVIVHTMISEIRTAGRWLSKPTQERVEEEVGKP